VNNNKKSEISIQSYPLPWNRILARGIDTYIFFVAYIFVCLPLTIILLSLTPAFNSQRWDWIVPYIFIASRTCFFLFYEFFFLSLFSATPGKALLRIRVIGKDGGKLSFSSALSRTLRVCGYLYLFFMPYLSFLIPASFMAHLYTHTRTGKLMWDQSDKWSVINKQDVASQRFKMAIGALLLILIILTICFIIIDFLRAPFARGWLYKSFYTFILF